MHDETRARERLSPMPVQGRPKRAVRQPVRFRSPGSSSSGGDTAAQEADAAHEAGAVSCPPQAQLKRLRRGREVFGAPDQALQQEEAPAMHSQLEDSLPACLEEQAAQPPAGEVRQGGAGGKAACVQPAADKDLPFAHKRKVSEQPAHLVNKRRRTEVRDTRNVP